MFFSVTENGREFVIDWSFAHSSPTSSTLDLNNFREFQIGCHCFQLEYWLTDMEVTLKLLLVESKSSTVGISRSHSSESESSAEGIALVIPFKSAISNLHYPRRVTASRNDKEFHIMERVVNGDEHRWGPVSLIDVGYLLMLHRPHPVWGLDTAVMKEARDQLVHVKVVIDFGPQMKKGEANVLESLGRLLKDGTGSDVNFIAQGEVISAHTLIIQSGSPVLAAMFQHNMTESSSRSVIIKDLEPSVFRQLLHYLYTGDAPQLEEEDMTEPLFIAADKYQIDSLKDWCESVLSKKINVDCAVRYLILSNFHSAEKLQEHCLKFIVDHNAVFWKRSDFRELCHNHPDLFYEATKKMNECRPSSAKDTSEDSNAVP